MNGLEIPIKRRLNLSDCLMEGPPSENLRGDETVSQQHTRPSNLVNVWEKLRGKVEAVI